ncbi:Dam family site-specific DNA-(adenine-N6)-methyltransferase [Klebsiella pneumoniae]|uniref:DNA adenine methylase n=1 Tax=Klebsiella pneumoniae TaxID=573 RepID=UPI0007CC5EC7|nr:Dam family site-specific DNA-(adenine-N6)-methyltransferase [Klebsiella pneumoniae]MBY8394708.1 Dam family site-specific DNA-(adenine-N6)-methyltransferase [Klebsiella pneumoniae]SAV70621.1 DNA adenine methylase [Klebsiella pneumoniae]HBT1918350.1 Dam family site-specific DNA-(adenine-N6)-methyltransferase [Klebsiella pneumoniae]HBW5654788.1 Dam family site-specific DNA-(adenine-N6)-methyltransferase [Klebsiella pneumoniae]HCD4408016.1 Dam family site-specific DNA-(adenine-N6)-methyltransfe
MSKPFLKWAGGKYTQLADLFVHIPAGKRLIEPFVGGGSVFLNTEKHADYLLADVNPDLINLYQMLAVVPDEVELKARWMFEHMRSPDGYELIRSEFNAQTLDATERAAAFLYLNRHCFNGLMRYNQANKFNVGWGGYKAPYYPMDEMKAFAAMAHNCVFMTADYRRTISVAGKGDVVYCDPPYEPMPGTTGFTAYAAGGFSWENQVDLAKQCVSAFHRGARIVISNSSAPKVLDLYREHGFNLQFINARRSISCKSSTREVAKDVVAIL